MSGHEETSDGHTLRVTPKYEKHDVFKIVKDTRNRERPMRLKKSDETWQLNAVYCIPGWLLDKNS